MTKKQDRALKIIMAALLFMCACAILILAMLPPAAIIDVVSANHKFFHFLEFFIFTIIVLVTLAVYDVKRPYTIALPVLLAFVVISESVQIPLAHRTFSVMDMVADGIGILAGFIVFWLARVQWIRLKR